MSLNGAAQIEETATQFLQYALLHSLMCSSQTDNNSRKLRLHCACQFPWCALGLNEASFRSDTYVRRMTVHAMS
jgi:hypothetical protein